MTVESAAVHGGHDERVVAGPHPVHGALDHRLHREPVGELARGIAADRRGIGKARLAERGAHLAPRHGGEPGRLVELGGDEALDRRAEAPVVGGPVEVGDQHRRRLADGFRAPRTRIDRDGDAGEQRGHADAAEWAAPRRRLGGRPGGRADRACQVVERAAHLGGGLVAVARELGEQPVENDGQAPREVRSGELDRRRRLVPVPGLHHLRRRPVEGGCAGEHLVEHAAQAVEIGAGVDVGAHALLGAHVARRPDGEAWEREPLVERGHVERPRDAEVGDHRLAGLEQDVLRLDVAVDDALPVGIRERRRRPARDPDRLEDREGAVPGEPLAQRFPRDPRHHVIEDPVGVAGVVEREDVRMGEARGGADLEEEPLRPEGRGEPRPEHLERDAAVMAEVVREVHRGRAAAAELALDRVPPGQGGLQALHPLRHALLATWETRRNIRHRPGRGQTYRMYRRRSSSLTIEVSVSFTLAAS
jgi:hypothetical protein